MSVQFHAVVAALCGGLPWWLGRIVTRRVFKRMGKVKPWTGEIVVERAIFSPWPSPLPPDRSEWWGFARLIHPDLAREEFDRQWDARMAAAQRNLS